uniref:Uncharacterized protein n=1 Tax=Ciona intestinalis TaxID=7719 RepID=H2Y352_CIOIN
MLYTSIFFSFHHISKAIPTRNLDIFLNWKNLGQK